VAEKRSPASKEVRDETSGKSWEIVGRFFRGFAKTDERVVLLIREITHIVLLQERLRRSETMATLGSVVGGVAHEVRNPLFAVSAILDAFEARFGDREEYQQYMARLRKELDRLNGLMRDLLQYGKPARLELTEGRLAEVVKEAVGRCEELARRQDVRVVLDPDSEPARVRMDHDGLLRAVQNVIDNAIQHSPEGSEVRVDVTLAARGDARRAKCRVSDQGPGIEPAQLARVFEPFFSRRPGGTGLGLPIVARIVEDHGGEIEISNRPEGGTVVEIELECLADTRADPED
jgi:signal transduction histidine kinase